MRSTADAPGLAPKPHEHNHNPIDARWRDLTKQGNAAFHEREFELAAPFYEAAMQEAEEIFENVAKNGARFGGNAAPLLIVSALNAARCRQGAGLRDEMESALAGAARRLTETLREETAPTGLRRACAEHLPYLMNGYKALITEEKRDPAGFEECFTAARNAALHYWNAIFRPH